MFAAEDNVWRKPLRLDVFGSSTGWPKPQAESHLASSRVQVWSSHCQTPIEIGEWRGCLESEFQLCRFLLVEWLWCDCNVLQWCPAKKIKKLSRPVSWVCCALEIFGTSALGWGEEAPLEPCGVGVGAAEGLDDRIGNWQTEPICLCVSFCRCRCGQWSECHGQTFCQDFVCAIGSSDLKWPVWLSQDMSRHVKTYAPAWHGGRPAHDPRKSHWSQCCLAAQSSKGRREMTRSLESPNCFDPFCTVSSVLHFMSRS